MIMSLKTSAKNSIYRGSAGAVWGQFGTILAQCGTTLEFSSGSGDLKNLIKNSHLVVKFAENPVWEILLYKFCHHTEKNPCFSMGYMLISECKISLILKVYKWAFHFVYALLYFLPACWLPEMDGRMTA